MRRTKIRGIDPISRIAVFGLQCRRAIGNSSCDAPNWQEAARSAPAVKTGTHMTGDTFFHGPGLSAQTQYIAKLYGADDYMITEMLDRDAVNFDQGNLNEATLQHLDPAPGQTAGGFAETVDIIAAVGSRMVDHIVAHWPEWKSGVPPRPLR